MNVSQQISDHLRDSFYGVNWTEVDLKHTLQDVTVEEALKKVYNLNTIASIVWHINYFIERANFVLEGKEMPAGSQEESLTHPEIKSEEDWEKLQKRLFENADKFSNRVKDLNSDQLFEIFIRPANGNYLRNILGNLEHTYYHLGQIVLLKKILRYGWVHNKRT